MAALVPIEVFGIAFDREIAILHDKPSINASWPSSPAISLTSISADEDSIACQPWFSLAHPVESLLPESPSAPVLSLVPPECYTLNDATAPATYSQRTSAWDEGYADDDGYASELDPNDPSPLGTFARKPERHEQIAISLAVDTTRDVPYIDYVPDPGSGPGSPAISVATEKIGPSVLPPGVKPAPVEWPISQNLRTPSPPSPIGPSPMSRYLSAKQPHEWLAVVLSQSSGNDHGQDQAGGIDHHTPISSMSLNGNEDSRDDSSSTSSATVTSQPIMTSKEIINAFGALQHDDSLTEADLIENNSVLQDLLSQVIKKERRAVAEGRPRGCKRPRQRHNESPPLAKKPRLSGDEYPGQ